MTKTRKLKKFLLTALALLLLSAGGMLFALYNASWGFSRPVSEAEAALRLEVVQAAEGWLGCKEEDGSHQAVIDLYNSHTPLAQGYKVQYTDSWCSTFASAAAIASGRTDIIPTECGCQRHIGLFQALGCWEESDTYLPLPGDYIFYAWEEFSPGDCTGWADHVGIVVGTWGPFIKVIEGNKDDAVAYRYTTRWDPTIRGYGLPDYASLCQ